MNRLSTVATGGFNVNLNLLEQSHAIMLDVCTYDGASYRAGACPGSLQNSKNKAQYAIRNPAALLICSHNETTIKALKLIDGE